MRHAPLAGVLLAIPLCTLPARADEPPPAPQPGSAPASPQPPSDGAASPGDAPGAAPDTAAAAAPEPEPRPIDTTAAAPELKTIEVRVIGQNADALQKIPGSGQLIATKDIQRAQPTDIAEVLRRVPGLIVRQEQGGGLRLDISVRGLDATRSRRVLVLEDGVPVANNPYGEPDLYYSTPVERIRGIEVVKGSGSILFGPQTVGGVVQFLTHAPPDSRRVYLQMDGGLPGQFELVGRYGDSWNGARYIAQIFGKRGDGVRGEDYYATDVFAKLAVPISASSELTAKVGFHDEAANSTDVGLTQGMFQAAPRRPTIAPFDIVRLQRVDGSLLHKLWLGESAELRTLAYATSTTRLWRRQDYDRGPGAPGAPCSGALPGGAYDRIVGDIDVPCGAIYFRDTNTIRDRQYAVFGVEPRLTARFTTAGVAHTLDAGARFLTESSHRAQRAGDTPLSESGELQNDESGSTVAVAAYVQDRIAFTDNLLVTPGFRFEYATSKRAVHRAVIAGVPQDVTIEGASGVAAPIPGIGMVFGAPRLHAYGGVHLGFAPPRLTTSVTANGIDEQLDPERATHYEAGVRAAPWRFLRAEATLFLSNFDNQIIPATRAGTATTDLVNGGKTQHLGLEAGVRLELGRALRWPLVVDVTASYTGLSAVFVGGPNSGNRLPYASEHTASAILDVEHPFGIGAQVSWTIVGPQFADEANTKEVDVTGRIGEIPARNALDVVVRYLHKATGLGASVTVKNVLDDVYVISRRPDGIFPAGFRQVLGSLRWTYEEGR